MTSIPRTSGIYQFRCVPTGHIYVGGSRNLQKRHSNHRYDLRHHRHDCITLQAAWDHYGSDAFVFEVLEYCTIDRLIEREQYWADMTRCNDPAIGFNRRLFVDSDRGLKKSPQAIAKMRARGQQRGKPVHFFTPEARENHRISQLARRGRGFTEEHKQAIGRAQLGKKHAPDRVVRFGQTIKDQFTKLSPDERALRVASKRRDYVFVLTDPSGHEYRVINLTAFCLEHGLDRSSFTRIMQGKKTSYKGWTCRREPQPL